MKKVLIAIAVSVIIIAGIALIVMYNVGDRLIEEAITSDILSSKDVPIDQDNASAIENEKVEETQAASSVSVTPVPEQASVSSTPTPELTKTPESNNSTQKPLSKAEQKVAQKAAEEKKITTEKIVEIKNEVAPTDKISAAALILKRLSADDINVLKGYLSGGLSAEEKEKAKQIAYSRFTAEEISEIKSMYSKYMK